MSRELLQQALDLIQAQKAWIYAVPQDVVLPTMPGLDRDAADELEEALREELAKPEPVLLANRPNEFGTLHT